MAQSTAQRPHHQDCDEQTPQPTPHDPVTFAKTLSYEDNSETIHLIVTFFSLVMCVQLSARIGK